MYSVHSVQSSSRCGKPGYEPLRVERLDSQDRPRLLEHFLGHSDDDLRLRFGRCMTAYALGSYVAELDIEAATSFVSKTTDGMFVAVIEGFSYEARGRRHLEVAFSTLPGWRRRGLATHLFRTVVAAAAARGVHRIVARCDVRNGAMRALLRGTDAATEVDVDEVSAWWMTPD